MSDYEVIPNEEVLTCNIDAESLYASLAEGLFRKSVTELNVLETEEGTVHDEEIVLNGT